jgi:hypothetical protein
MIEYTLSLNATQNDQDISSLPLRGLKQELSASLNTQSQASDDPFHAQDSSCAPRDSLYNSPFFSQALQMLPTHSNDASHPSLSSSNRVSRPRAFTPSRIQKKPYQGFWRSEVHVLRLRIRFVRQDLASVHSFENLPAHEEVNGIQPAPFPRLPMTHNIHPFLPQTVPQDLTHLPPSRIQKTPYQGFWRSEVHVLCLRIRLVRQDLACVYSDGFGSCFLFGCVFSTIIAGPPYIPFCLYRLPKRHMKCAPF